MTRTRTLLACLFASTLTSACATIDAAHDAELDDLEIAIEDAVLAGDYDLAVDLGSDWAGVTVDGNGSEAAASGFFAAHIIAGEDTISDVRGRLMSPITELRHQVRGNLAAPIDNQMRGLLTANTHVMSSETTGTMYGDYRTNGGATDSGTVRATWDVEGSDVTAYVTAFWRVDSDGNGRMFGLWEQSAAPSWEEGARVRIDVNGLTQLTIAQDKLWVTQLIEEEEVEATASATVNGEAYELVYSERSCPDFEDALCNSEAYEPGEGTTMDTTLGSELTTLMGRGGVSVVEEPSAENEYTTVLIIDDMDYPGASAYEIELNPAG